MPDTETRDMDTRTLQIRAATVNEEERSVEAVLSSESRVEMWDWRAGEMVEEVLLADGVDIPRQLPLLDTHSRFELDDVLGSIRSIRREEGGIVGRLFFAEGDERADRAWNKVRQGHLTDVSVGYRVSQKTDVMPGKTETVAGREFTAGESRLRIVTSWKLKEASVVPIGADAAAKMRQAHNTGAHSMADQDKERQEQEAKEAAARAEQERQEREAKERSEAEAKAKEASDAARKEAADAERQRVVELRKLAGEDVSRELLDKAIEEGWDESRASREFLAHVRSSRDPNGSFAIHSRSHEADCNSRSLAAGLLAGQGFDPVGKRVDPKSRDKLTEQDADRGHEYRGMSAIDICKECVRLDGKTAPREYEDLVRVAMSGTHLDRVFTTNVYARLIEGWEETPDTTGWCQSEDVPNFMTQEDITLRQNAALNRLPRGGTAKHADFSDDYETYAVARYAKQFVADEQDFIDDRLSALMAVPQEMGAAARRLHPDLVYSVILENPTLTATTGALFNATAETTAGGHANQTTAVLGSAGLTAAITDMAQKRLDNVPLNIRPRYLIVPPDLEWTAKELLQSGEQRDTTANTLFMTINVIRGENLMLIVESRIDATGVQDPRTTPATSRTGSATNWFLAAGRRTIKKLYLRGTGRMPSMRSFTLTQGQWGMGWDIKHDAGAAAVDYRGMHRSTGTG